MQEEGNNTGNNKPPTGKSRVSRLCPHADYDDDGEEEEEEEDDGDDEDIDDDGDDDVDLLAPASTSINECPRHVTSLVRV